MPYLTIFTHVRSVPAASVIAMFGSETFDLQIYTYMVCQMLADMLNGSRVETTANSETTILFFSSTICQLTHAQRNIINCLFSIKELISTTYSVVDFLVNHKFSSEKNNEQNHGFGSKNCLASHTSVQLFSVLANFKIVLTSNKISANICIYIYKYEN